MSAIRPIAFLLGTLAAILSAPTGQAQTFPKAGEVLRDSLGARVWQIGYRMTPTGYATLERSGIRNSRCGMPTGISRG